VDGGLTDHAVVVLAAGRGRRMGGPKALMEVDGDPWWREQERRLGALGARRVWVVSAVVREAMIGGGMEAGRMVVGDDSRPMMSSVVAGALALRDDPPAGVFVLPVDVPAAGRDAWAALAGGGGEVRVPEHRGVGGHPVWLGWPFVESRVVDAPEGSRLDELIGPVARRVAVEDGDVVVNLNTPVGVAAWLARGA
jgi:CTP:molybdopterin cytidylyltransferase MocA